MRYKTATREGQIAPAVDSTDLTPRERKLVSGKWAIVSPDGLVDALSAAEDENESWERFLDNCTAPKLVFVDDGWKAVKMP